MDNVKKVKSISIWIFIVPFLAINICLILITQFHGFFRDEDIIINTIPYFDGGASISRTARVFPTYLIFKPAMFFTSFLLVKYWYYNKSIILSFKDNHPYVKYIVFFGVGSALLLTLHSIFLGVKFDYTFYKVFRKVVILCFILSEIIAQLYLVLTLYSIKHLIINHINEKILSYKRILVSILIIVALVSIPIITTEGNKALKHALEWNYFVGVLSFYILTPLMWKRKKSE